MGVLQVIRPTPAPKGQQISKFTKKTLTHRSVFDFHFSSPIVSHFLQWCHSCSLAFSANATLSNRTPTAHLNLALGLIHHLILRRELHADTVHTMSLVGRSTVSLALEDMSQMTTAVRAHDLCSRHAERAISVTSHSSRDVVEVCWPSAARLELMGSFVERGITTCAGVDARVRQVLVVFAASGHFSSLLSKDAELLWRSVSDVYTGRQGTHPLRGLLATPRLTSGLDKTSCRSCWHWN